MELSSCKAIIVGGASGMARATAERLVRAGATVAILDLPSSAGAEVAAELGTTFHPCNVTDDQGTESAIGAAVEVLGGLNVAVNTAGGGRGARTVGKDGPHPLDVFRASIELNLIAAFNVARLAAWHMSKNEPNDDGERGVIISTSSIAAFEGQIGQAGYSAAKAGITGMSFVMARDLGSLGIRANAIAPSLFDTGITSAMPDDMTAALTKSAAFPHRMGRPDEFARLAVAIIENPMLNGTTIRLDAGQRFGPK